MKKRILSLCMTLALVLALAPAAGADGTENEHATFCAGIYHSAAITDNGSLWMWGANGSRQLGDGGTVDRNTPSPVLEKVIAVSAGGHYTAAITDDNALWTWGSNGYGQLGTDDFSGYSALTDIRTGKFVKAVAHSDDHGSPVKVLEDVVAVSAGYAHVAAIKKDGSLWTWGSTDSGQTGNGNKHPYIRYESSEDARLSRNGTLIQPYFEKVMDNVKAVSTRNLCTAAIKTDGSLWTWGRNANGQLGDGTYEDRSVPIKVMDNISTVSAGAHCMAAIKTDGSLWAWGVFDAAGNSVNATPVKVMDDVVQVNAGYRAVFAVKSDGSLWTWGRNDNGQLGDGTTTVRLNPEKILDNVIAVSAGLYHSVATKEDGSLWAWGLNEDGQLGDGSFLNRTTPVEVLISDVRAPGDPLPVKVQFNSNGGDREIESITVKYGGKIAPPTSPTKKDSTFAGWFYDKDFADKVDFKSDTFKKDTILHAAWESSLHTVTFQTNATAGAIPVAANSHGTVTPPQIPTKANYSFAGWYKDVALTKPWSFANDKATGDVTLYGKWVALASGTVTAVPNQSKVLVDGKLINFEAYTINGSNYFKLRDIAYVLNGTDKRVSVGWDSFYKAITLRTGTSYSSVGGELSPVKVATQTVPAAPTTIYLNDQVIFLSTYVINSNHFFKLRDLGVALNFGVTWDGSVGTISIQSGESYSADQ